MQINKKIAIFGSSGFAREVFDICMINGCSSVVFIDRVLQKQNDDITECLIYPESEVSVLSDSGYEFVVGIGDGKIRKEIVDRFPTVKYANIIHPDSSFGFRQSRAFDKVEGNVVAAGVRFTNNIVIGNHGVFNLNVTVGHDCVIKDFVTISPGANVSGNVFIDEYVYIGTGSTILEGSSINKKLKIGVGSVVGAGAVVLTDVNGSDTVVGIPAKSINAKA